MAKELRLIEILDSTGLAKLGLAIERAERSIAVVTNKGTVEKQGTVTPCSISQSDMQHLVDAAKEKYNVHSTSE